MRRAARMSKIAITADYVLEKASDVIGKSQQILGKNTNIKSQNATSDMQQTLGKKHVRIVSAALYILCVSIFAIGMGIYYAAHWRPCTKKYFFLRNETEGCSCAWTEYNWGNLSFWNQTQNTCNSRMDNQPNSHPMRWPLEFIFFVFFLIVICNLAFK